MQTPLLFKLLLLLAVSLRLIKSEKKVSSIKPLNYFVLQKPDEKITTINLEYNEGFSAIEIIKYCYRKSVRKNQHKEISYSEFQSLQITEQLICVAYQFSKYYQKGGMFRFVWYGNNWLIAFGQSLAFIEEKWHDQYKAFISEMAFPTNTSFTYQNTDWEKVYPFPDGQQEYEALKVFEKHFDLTKYLEKITAITVKKQTFSTQLDKIV